VPELPEVETVRRGLAPHVVGRRITRVVVREPRLRWRIDRRLPEQLAGRRVEEAGRRGKYLLLRLDSGDRLIVHLGMSGRFNVVTPEQALKKHDHVDLELDSGRLLRFNDARRFGAILLWRHDAPTHKLLAGMGPEPLEAGFDGAHLFRLSRGRSAPVKSFVMDGRVVVGAGNIYASEALFRAGIRPTRAAGRLTRAHCDLLAQSIRAVLQEAVEQGGTTLRDFISADGFPGYFQTRLFVYDREGEPCLRCRAPVRRLVIGQRSSFYCPRCQK
jgi:formamidopyrimidine-DNA glycosylase